MFSVQSSGNFNKTRAWLKAMAEGDMFSDMDKYGQRGVDALSKATPYDRGITANAWEYRVIRTKTSVEIEWSNTNVVSGAKIAILLQYGHGTGTGGYIAGQDYINPAIQPVFDEIAASVLKKVK